MLGYKSKNLRVYKFLDSFLFNVSGEYWKTKDVTITSEELLSLGLTLCSVLIAFEQGKIFIVPYLLSHGASDFTVSLTGPSQVRRLVRKEKRKKGGNWGYILTRVPRSLWTEVVSVTIGVGTWSIPFLTNENIRLLVILCNPFVCDKTAR